jgi:transposase-like protein
MLPISYSGYRFPPDIIQRAIWMYLRFTLSYRDVEELMAERGIVVTYESIRRWVLTLGPTIARRLRARRPKPHSRWHLDEMSVRVGGKLMVSGCSTHPTNEDRRAAGSLLNRWRGPECCTA